MASAANLRSRRSAAQLHALVGVEREIHAQDTHGRRKYLREFSESFRSYESPLSPDQIHNALQGCDMILIGDYHALPASQRYAAWLLEQRAMAGDRPLVLGVETIFARDQHVLEEWWRREIDDAELRQRIRFDLDWGYDWAPFYELLTAARDHAEAIYGLDCMPRENLRQIGARDRHAAAKLAEIRHTHPEAVILVLFGESHLAPNHLPRAVRQQIPQARVLTVLQNVDTLYWRAAGENANKVDAVRVSDDVICVFNATPLDKYESYRLFLDQWSRCDGGPDFAPAVYNLVDSLASFLEINRYSPRNSTQPKFLVDLLPEVYGHASDAMLQRVLMRQGIAAERLDDIVRSVQERGCAYIAQANAFCMREFQLVHAAEDAARFLHHACRGLPDRAGERLALGNNSGGEWDRFFLRIIEHALADCGARILCPSRPEPPGEVGQLTLAAFEKAAKSAVAGDGDTFEATARGLGYRLGNRIYSTYLSGKIKPATLRRLFLLHLDSPGEAHKLCRTVLAKTRLESAPPRFPVQSAGLTQNRMLS
jgi:uncharacterized iron-regulated protein